MASNLILGVSIPRRLRINGAETDGEPLSEAECRTCCGVAVPEGHNCNPAPPPIQARSVAPTIGQETTAAVDTFQFSVVNRRGAFC